MAIVTHTDSTGKEKCLIVEGGTWHPGKPKYTMAEYESLIAAGTIDPRSHVKPTTADPKLVRILVPHSPPKWGFTKGEYADKYHKSETSKEGARRELMEETGLSLPLDRFVSAGNIGNTVDKNHVYEVNIRDSEKDQLEAVLNKRIADNTGELLDYKFVEVDTVCNTHNLNFQSKQACNILKSKLRSRSRSRSRLRSKSKSSSPGTKGKGISKTRRNRK